MNPSAPRPEEATDAVLALAYILASILFILALRGLSHPRTAVRANLLGATGMLVAVAATLLDHRIVTFPILLAGLAVGGLAGDGLALKVKMTAMPQMVGLLNGFGGAASVLVAITAIYEVLALGQPFAPQLSISVVVSVLIGTVTFFGSLIAVFKLQEVLVPSGAVASGWLKAANALLGATALVLAALAAADPPGFVYLWGLVAVAAVLGVTLVIPIGGADMPVVIALLNSYSGLAAAATGFVLNNTVLIIAGSLVGASGIILSSIMSKAMNRSLLNVFFGGFGAQATAGPSADDMYRGKVTSASAEEAAMILESARRVVFVPGYGMAVSQAQHAVRELTNLLTERGAEVLFAIHPVAGRMPGHMNVLLAEADIPYDKLLEMDQANPLFPDTDVAIVIGANDVVNPVARTDPKSPIAGMPILDVDKARTVMIVKRSLSPGFAGIPNPLFAAPNTMMLFGDGKKVAADLVAALKAA